MFGLFKKKEKPKKYAVAKLVDNLAKKDTTTTSPLLSNKRLYIVNIGKLKQALVSRNETHIRSYHNYLDKNGLSMPTTLMGCDRLIEDIESWEEP